MLENYPNIDNDAPCSVSQAKAFEAELDARMGEAKWEQKIIYPATLYAIRREIASCRERAKSLTAGSAVLGLTARADALEWVIGLIEGGKP